MTSIRITFLATFAALALPACCFGGTVDSSGTASADTPSIATPAPGSPSSASCDVIASLSTCRDLGPAAFALGEDLQRSLCTGTYTSGGSCPAENRVGSCDEGGGSIRRYYSTGTLAYTAESARQDCQIMPGATFTP